MLIHENPFSFDVVVVLIAFAAVVGKLVIP